MPSGKPKPGEIYLLHKPLFRNSNYPHPVIVIRVNGARATVNFFSSEFTLQREGKDFTIDENEPEFSTTGLKKTSFLIAGGSLEIPAGNLHDFWGTVPNGDLRKRISNWWGEAI